jgi:N-acetylneuraminic acid mutarotase
MKKSNKINLLVVLALVILLILPVQTPVNATGSWVMKQGLMSTGRTRLASAVVNGKIYAIGGDSYGNQENYTIEEYNPGTDTWTLKTITHLPRINFSAAAVNNKIYIIGGSHQGLPYQYDNAVEEYDPATNQIALKAPMSMKRNSLGVVTLNNKIYAVGGFNNTGDKTIVEVYDPFDTSNGYDTNGNPKGKWTTKASMPTPRHNFSIAAANGKIYAIAGKGAGTIKKVEEYNPQTDTWTAKTDLTLSWDANVATSVHNKIYMVGGGISGVYNQKIAKEYDPITDTWTDLPDMLKGMQNGAVTCIGSQLYAFGGEINTPYGQIEMFDLGKAWVMNQGVMPIASITGAWTIKQGIMSMGRYRLKPAIANGMIYAIGGDNFGNQENYTIEEYNPASDTWMVKAVSLRLRRRFGATALNNKIYIMGGSYSTPYTVYDNYVEEYDPVTNQVIRKADIPTAREDMGVIAVNNKIYAIGGFTPTGYVNTVEVYDPQTNTWTTKASMPTAKNCFSIAEANGKIYTIGGYGNGGPLKKVEEYDPQTNVWTVKTDLPDSWTYNAATSLNGKVYVAGGTIPGSDNCKVFKEYDPVADTWKDMPNMLKVMCNQGAVACLDGKIYAFGGDLETPVGQIEMFDPNMIQTIISNIRTDLASAVINGKVYAIGGDKDKSGSGNDENYTIGEYNPASDTWTVKTFPHLYRKYFAAAAVNNKIYIIGGIHNGFPCQTRNNEVEEYDPVTNTVTRKANMPTAREYLGVAVVNNKIYAMGGVSNFGVVNTVEVYDPQTNVWTTVAGMPTAKYYFSIAEANGKIYTIAGCNGTTAISNVEEYNPQTNVWTTKTNLSASWQCHDATSFNGKIYVAGGTIPGSYNYNFFKEYDPISDTWLVMPDMLTNTQNGAVACADGKIYAFGGEMDAPYGQIEVFY